MLDQGWMLIASRTWILAPSLLLLTAACGACGHSDGGRSDPDGGGVMDAAVLDASVADASATCESDGGDGGSCAVIGGLVSVPPAESSVRSDMRVRWTRVLSDDGVANGIRLPGNSTVAFVAGGNKLRLVSAGDGSGDTYVQGLAAEPLSQTLVADQDDNIYYVGRLLYSVRSNGVSRWNLPIIGQWPGGNQLPAGHSPAVRGDLVLFAARNGVLYAARRGDGSTAWQKMVSPDPDNPPIGSAETLFVATRIAGLGAFEISSGSLRWSHRRCDRSSGAFPLGFFGGLVLDTEYDVSPMGVISNVRNLALDHCGNDVSLAPDGRFLVDRRNRLVSVIRAALGFEISIRDSLGGVPQKTQIDTASSDKLALAAVGADDHLYVIIFRDGSPFGTLQIVRLFLPETGPAEVKQTLSLGDAVDLSASPATMDDSGSFYIGVGNSLVAVETPSPGPVRGVWSQPLGDARNSKFVP